MIVRITHVSNTVRPIFRSCDTKRKRVHYYHKVALKNTSDTSRAARAPLVIRERQSTLSLSLSSLTPQIDPRASSIDRVGNFREPARRRESACLALRGVAALAGPE